MNNNNKVMLWIVKGVITIFNVPATGYVFYDMFKHTDRPVELAVFNTFMAVLAVDMVFLWIMGVLEDDTLLPIKRLPAAITSLMLALLIVVIGIMDEGTVLAFAPRIGLLLLVFNNLVSWGTDWRITYRSREHQEQKLRDDEVLARRRMNQKTFIKAMDGLESKFKEKHMQRILDQLGMTEDAITTERSVATPELPDGIFVTPTGAYGWIDNEGKEVVKTTQDKDYTLRGAKLALARSYKNGQQD